MTHAEILQAIYDADLTIKIIRYAGWPEWYVNISGDNGKHDGLVIELWNESLEDAISTAYSQAQEIIHA